MKTALIITIVNKKGNKVTPSNKVVFSKDGKTMTQTQTGTNAQGQAYTNVIVRVKK